MKISLNHFSIYFLVNLFLVLNTCQLVCQEAQIQLSTSYEQPNNILIKLDVTLEPNQFIYANSIDLSVDDPEVILEDLQINKQPQTSNNPKLQDTAFFSGNFTITCKAIANPNLTTEQNIASTNLHFSYLLNTQKHITQAIYEIDLLDKSTDTKIINKPENKIVNYDLDNQDIALNQNDSNKITNKSIWEKIAKFSKKIQTALRTSESNTFRLILVFLLGLLMSLTPCIYPMIPITAGILQAQGSSSIGRSFVLAFTYTLGISTTFALFGLIAALTGHLFGQLLVNPIFIIIIIGILAYLALSMFDLYDMYVPKFMSQENNYTQKKGSLLSVFIFGVISGSMASPCLSPGLALLLSIVATLGNNFLGFIMLFMFGLGLSVPLLVVGTFSNSINMIPKSGLWMIEVKKIFGFMLLGMCVYLLSNILSEHVIAWIIALFIFGAGVYYLQNASKYDGKNWYYLKNILGILLIVLSLLMSMQAVYKTYFNETKICHDSNWLTNYEAALKQAYANNQNLLIDCGADWCSICKAIDKKILNDPVIKAKLCDLVLLKVDATNQDSEPYVTLKAKYNIMGVPAILLINPTDNSLIKKWGSEIYDLPKNEFVEQLN